MEKSRHIWEQVPIAPHSIPEKYRGYYQNLLAGGHVNVEFNSNALPTVSINAATNHGLLNAVKTFCGQYGALLDQLADGIPTNDKQRFVVEMAHRLKIVALHEGSEFGKALASLRDTATKGPGAVLRNAAISYIALYYFEHRQTAE